MFLRFRVLILWLAVYLLSSASVAQSSPSQPGASQGSRSVASDIDSTVSKHLSTLPTPSLRGVADGYGNLPLSFESNKGQTDPSVQFTSRGDGYALFLKQDEAVLALYKSGTYQRTSTKSRRLHRNLRQSALAREAELIHITMSGANPHASIAPMEALPGKSNYFVGNDPKKWITGAPTYKRVKYSGIYPGVDLVYYGNRQHLEFDYVVAPKADPGVIRLHIDTRGSLNIHEDGSLKVETPGGQFALDRPEIYQLVGGEKRLVDGGFVKRSSTELGIRVGTYDRTLPLIVDPVLTYSTYLGGSGDDELDGIATDSAGNAYLMGTTYSLNFPTLNGYTSTANTSGTIFVSKLDPTGTSLLYSTYLGGTGGEYGWSMAGGQGGIVYLAGETDSSDYPVVRGFQSSHAGSMRNGFVAAIDTTQTGVNSLVYSTYLGGGGNGTNPVGDVAMGVAVDSAGLIYVTGQTTSDTSTAAFPTTSNAYQSSLASTNGNAFLTVLNPSQTGSNSLVYSTYLGGSSTGLGDYGTGVTVDAASNAYITGMTTSAGSLPFPTTLGAYQTSLANANGNAFVAEIATRQSGTGSLVYSTYLGGSTGSYGDDAAAIALDASGKVYIAGSAGSSDFPTTAGAYQTSNSTGGKAFIAKIDPAQTGSGSLIYATYLGGTNGPQGDTANGLAVDAQGSAYVVGNTSSTDFPTTPGAIQSSQKSNAWNGFFTQLNSSGTALLYSTYWGGSCGATDATYGDLLAAIALDSAANVYLGGSTCSSDYPTTSNAYQATLAGTYNAFVAKFATTWLPPPSQLPPSITSISPLVGAVGTLVTVTGTNFGATQSASTVSFTGFTAAPTSWNATQIIVPVPVGATTGNVVVTVAGLASNGATFSVPPAIASLSPTSGAVGTPVTITGTNFGATQSGAVTFNGTTAVITSWSNTQIVVTVPSGATSGNVVVTVGNMASLGVNFTVPLVTQSPVLQIGIDDTPATVNLSAPVNLDWVIWGADGSTPAATRSAAGLISDISMLGGGNASVYANGFTQYTWSGGTPIASSSGSTPYINAYGLNAGFQFTVPADANVKTLKVYASSYANIQINASLSDGSSPAVSSNSVTYSSNETYSIDFRAASAGQTLTVQLFSTDAGSGVSMSAAVLRPHLPQVTIASPQDQQSFAYGTAIPVEVDAMQYDYGIASTTMSANGSQILASQTSPLITTWSNAPQGHYQLQAAAVDSNGLSGTAKAIGIDVIGTGGSLGESFGTVTNSLDLTTEGTADWIAFAMTNWNYTVGSQKAGVYQLISSPTIVGINQGSGTYYLSGGLFSFEDGTPDPQENGVTPVAWVGGPPQTGFELSVKADTTPRTLRLYCNASGATQLRAYLSDGGAPVVTDTSLQDSNAQYVFTINFNAASAGQNLVIDLTTANGGAIFLNAATLTGTSVPLPPQVTAVQPNSGVAGDPVTISGTAFGTQQGSVSFNGVQAIVASWTQTSISVFVPAGTGTGPVVVTTAAGTSNSDVLFAMRPFIFAITPTSGAIGTTVTLTGSGYGSVGAVSFNGVAASVSSWSDSQIVAVVPSGATSGAVIAIRNGTSSNSAWFTVLSGAQAAPLLKLRIDDTPSTVTLSNAVNFDWVIWGADGQTTTATRMAGANLISDPLNGANSSSLASGCRPTFSWSGGTPISNGASVTGCVSVADSGGGVLLTVPAGTIVQTLKVYVQGWGNPTAVAYLSDGSTETVVDSSVAGPSYVGEEKTYSFDFRAASGGQQLTVMMLGGFILESAVLQPHLPEVSLLTPTDGTSFAANSNMTLGLDPLQFDIQIAATAITVNRSPIFESATTPYSGVWQAPAGHYRIQATATDSTGLLGTSAANEVDVIGNGGVLTGSVTKLTISNTLNTDLTTEGTADWIIFAPPAGWPSVPYDDWAGILMDGDFKGVIRKNAVSPLISRARPLGQGGFSNSSGYTTEYFQFEDGTPDPADVQINDCLTAAGAQSGYEFKVKADTTLRTLRLHAGVANGQAHVKAFLSDGSAPIFVDDTLQPDQNYWAANGVYSIQYQAASANQTLTVRLTLDGTPSPNDDWKAVQLYAATIDGQPVPVTTGSDTSGPTLTVMSPATGTVFSQRAITIQGTVTDAQSGVAWVWCGDGVNFANVQGNTFTCSVELVGGANSVGITAGDKAGNEASTTLSVSFIPTVGQSASGKLLTPDQLNLLVGETHNIRKVGTDDVNQGDCGYYSSDTSVATVSSTDCVNATVTAVSPGTAEIISADAGATITVYDGTSLPAGTVQWSVPSTQGTINEITPQPPYTVQSYDASIQSIPPAFYARAGTYYVTAFSADGIQLRENQMLTGGWDPALYTHPLVPDFQGRIALPYPNLVGGTQDQMQQYPQGLVVYDATTGAGGYPVVYTYQNGALQHFGPGFNQYDPQAALIPSPDGTYYVSDPPYIKALDSLNANTDGTFPAKFSVAISGCSGGQNVHTGKMVLAGDGALYVPFGDYTTSQGTDSNGNAITIYPCNRLGVTRVNPDGTYQEMTLFDFPSNALYSAQALTNLSMISNTDQGAYIAFSDYSTAQAENDSADPPTPAVPPTAYLAVVSSGGMSLATLSAVPNGVYTISLQAADGSIVGSMPVPTACPDGSSGCTVTSMIKMDSGGNISQNIQNATPSYALSDGSIVANGGQTTYDANGNVTATSPYSVTVDWSGNLFATQPSTSGLSADLVRAHAMSSIASVSSGISQSIAASIPAPTGGIHANKIAVRTADVVSPSQQAASIQLINLPPLITSNLGAFGRGNPTGNGVTARPWYFALVWQNSFVLYPDNPRYLPNLQADITSQATNIKAAAFAALKKAYLYYPVTIYEGAANTGDNRANMVNGSDYGAQGASCGLTSPYPGTHDSNIYYLANMEQAQWALPITLYSSQDVQNAESRSDLMNTIGTGIGNNAAHEIAHQFLVSSYGMDDSSTYTYNGQGCNGAMAPWVYSGSGIHWESITAGALAQRLVGGWHK